MSLVDTFPYPPPHRILVNDAVVTPPRVSITFAPPRPISIDERWAAQLAHLASQHQNSDYNRIKFGPRGTSQVLYLGSRDQFTLSQVVPWSMCPYQSRCQVMSRN